MQAVRPVNLGGGVQLAEHRLFRAAVDGHPRARQLEDAQGVRRGAVERDVAGDRRERAQVEFGRAQRQQDGDGVVDAGVAVDDDGPSVHADTSP